MQRSFFLFAGRMLQWRFSRRYALWWAAALFFAIACAGRTEPTRAAVADMTFDLVQLQSGNCTTECPKVFTALGGIVETSPQSLLAFMRSQLGQRNLRLVVLLSSPGGSVAAAMRIGKLLRRVNAVVIVGRAKATEAGATQPIGGQCIAACVYALMGGVQRIVPKESVVALMRMYLPMQSENTTSKQHDDGKMRRVLTEYAKEMGVDPAVVELAEEQSDDKLRPLSTDEIEKLLHGAGKLSNGSTGEAASSRPQTSACGAGATLPNWQGGSGVVVGFLNTEQAIQLLQATQARTKLAINPNFLGNKRALIRIDGGENGHQVVALVPVRMKVDPGDRVRFEGGRLDNSLPCHYIPNLIVNSR